MPEKKTTERAAKDKEEGKSPSTQAGEFVREEIHHIREGKHGARNAKQAIAIGLSKARRAGVKLPAPKKGKVSDATRRKAAADTQRGEHPEQRPSPKRSRARVAVLKKEGTQAASKQALSRQGKAAAGRRTKEERSKAAKKAAVTRNANRKDHGEAAERASN